MTAQLLAELTTYVDSLDAIQRDFHRLFAAKQQALRQGDAAVLQRLAQPESDLTRKLQLLLGERHQLLNRARHQGVAAETLRELHTQLEQDASSPLGSRLERAAQAADELRRECWVQWVVTQRATRHYTAILELIANGGEQSPTYSQTPGAPGGGGAILDASA